MKALAQDSVDDEVLHQLWSERLPHKIRPLLIISESLDLDALAEMADHFMDMMEILPVMAVHSQDASSHTKKPQSPSATSQIERQLSEICLTLKNCQNNLADLQASQQITQKQLYEMRSQQQQQQQVINQLQQNLQHENRSRSRQRSLTPNRNGICYYHNKWGNDARKCTQPCKFSSIQMNRGN